MKKIFRIFSVLVVLLAVMGLASCGNPDPATLNISSESMLRTFMSNGSTTGVLVDNINVTAPITVTATKILDLNGKTITYTGTVENKDCILIGNGGRLTIVDNSTDDIDESGSIINNSSENDCYAVAVYANSFLTISNGQFKAKRSAIYVDGTATITNCYICADYDDENGNIADEDVGVFVGTSGSVTNISCTIDSGKYAIFNRGSIEGIGGGSYSAYANVQDSTSSSFKPVACIYNANNSGVTGADAATIGNITATVLRAENIGSANSYGVYNESGCTVGTVTANYSIKKNGSTVNDTSYRVYTVASN